MLGLHCESNQDWIERVKNSTAELLIDHAHCEKKAATNALSLINRYPDHHELVCEMADLAQEEMSHFRLVLDKMNARNISLTKDEGDRYAKLLHSNIRKTEPERLLDLLLVASLIEARSCERFQLLSEQVDDKELKDFYSSLLASEARHRNVFVQLAKKYIDETVVEKRLDELEHFEAEIVRSLPSGRTMHG